MDYDINLESLKQKSSEFQDLNTEINDLKSIFNSSYINTISSSEIGNITSEVSDSVNRLSIAYNNCEQWLQDYCQDLEALENSLANFSTANITALLDFKGEFNNIFSKTTIPTLQTGGDSSALSNISEENVQTNNNILAGDTVQDKIYNYLANAGFNNAAICAILSNIEYESGFNPNSLGDGKTSYGICQWHDDKKNGLYRYSNLKKYCEDNNLDYTTLEGQLSYLEYELKKDYPKVYNQLINTPNTKQGAYDAAYYWTVHYEVPKNANTQGKKRGSAASSKYWDKYNV